MTRTVVSDVDGLGVANWVPIVAAVAASVGGAVATRYIGGSGGPSQKQVESQLRTQQELEIARMVQQQQIQSQQTQELGSYLLPAVALFALVMLLR